jgi:hypothetical protein
MLGGTEGEVNAQGGGKEVGLERPPLVIVDVKGRDYSQVNLISGIRIEGILLHAVLKNILNERKTPVIVNRETNLSARGRIATGRTGNC